MLVADDQPNIRRLLEALFLKEGFTVLVAENGQKAVELAATNPIDILISDLIMPDMTGVEVLQKVKSLHPHSTAIIVTAYGTIKSAVEATRCGAYDYLQKPFDNEDIRRIVKRAMEQKNAAPPAPTIAPKMTQTASGNLKMDAVVGGSEKMQEIYRVVERAAESRATVLIRGESGTGKELVARALHYNSPRKDKPFVAVSCAALPDTLLESELFGHEKNAFTGAATARAGRFELSHQGTLFLDEIGDISPQTQIKMLRVLQEWEFERIGGSKPIKVDVRLVAATNKDLEKAVVEEKFRQDLYYRLNIISITLPPLRERSEDIPRLSEFFLSKFSKQNGRNITQIDSKTLAKLTAYRWTGNVRELENVIERAVVLSEKTADTLTMDLLPTYLTEK